MASLNKVTIIGNLGRNPDVRTMPNGEALAIISVATTESWKDKISGEKKEHTEWHRIVFYRGLAEVAGKYLKKGAPIYVEGKLRTRKWTDAAGFERYTTEIIADEMQMLGAKDSAEAGATQQPAQAAGSPVTDDWLADYDRAITAELAAEANRPVPPRRTAK